MLPATAQEKGEQPPASAPAAEPLAERDRGVMETIGRWVDQSLATVKSGLGAGRGTTGAIDAASEAEGKDAAAAASPPAASGMRIPTTWIVSGRQPCLRAPNGGPDCRTATQTLCQTRGYSSGRSLDIQSAQKCPAQILLSGRSPAEGECALETYVTRAVCQ
jgi:hypothetical protein